MLPEEAALDPQHQRTRKDRYCADIVQILLRRSLVFCRHFGLCFPVVHAHRHSFGFAVSTTKIINFICCNVFSVEMPPLSEHHQAGRRWQGCYPILLFFALRWRQPFSRLYINRAPVRFTRWQTSCQDQGTNSQAQVKTTKGQQLTNGMRFLWIRYNSAWGIFLRLLLLQKLSWSPRLGFHNV